MKTNYLVGCSGYYYPTWKNKFYPHGLQAKNWLAYYSSVFNSVELNGTFYRIPKLTDLQKYAKVTPAHFKFSVKMSKYITHIIKLKNTKQDIFDFQNLMHEGLSDKCGYFLFQLPPSFQYNEENLERIIENIPHHPHNIIEFRHISWWNEHVRKTLTSAGLTLCNIDYPGLKTEFLITSPIFYLRLHGNPGLFKSSYSEEALKNFYHHFPKDNNCCATYFNNTCYEAAYTNAQQFMEISGSIKLHATSQKI
jgi:uncharacterized protein YecE (DUF72 family)